MDSVSVIVLVKNRQCHLQNLLRGIQSLNGSPVETVVVHMNEAATPSPDFFTGDYVATTVESEATTLPLAQARNQGAAVASGQSLLFLDVDCIPDPNLVVDYQQALSQQPKAIAMGAVYYLPMPLPEDWHWSDLYRQGKPHPARTYLTASVPQLTEDYHLFWSLNFALSRSVWNDVGGFDEQFQGYGAEDTDFAFTAKACNVPLVWISGGSAYHQHHETYSPPLQHFHDIVRNADVFYRKWGWWPMEKWLQQFAETGYIQWSHSAQAIAIRATPTADAIAAARQSTL